MCLHYLYRFACAISSVITIEGVIMFLQDFTSHMPRQHMKAGRLSPGKEICELKKKKIRHQILHYFSNRFYILATYGVLCYIFTWILHAVAQIITRRISIFLFSFRLFLDRCFFFLVYLLCLILRFNSMTGNLSEHI